jgi:formate dehydrogenase maturation protein FdhE
MNILFVSIVIAPLMMIGALPAAQSISSDARIRLANGGPTADRDPYNQNAPDAVLEWQKKLDDFIEKAKTKGQEEVNAAVDELNAAWTKIVAGEHKPRAASETSWKSAKISFEKVSHGTMEVGENAAR